MKISIIAALAANGTIGKQNNLPWHLPEDMKFFKDKTGGHAVIMGRRNYESIPERFRPLPGRRNIVLTRDSGYRAHGCVVVRSVESALEAALAHGKDEAFVIGGAEIYSAFFSLADRMYLTEIQSIIEGDVFFPEFDKSQWSRKLDRRHEADYWHAHAFEFATYDRIN